MAGGEVVGCEIAGGTFEGSGGVAVAAGFGFALGAEGFGF